MKSIRTLFGILLVTLVLVSCGGGGGGGGGSAPATSNSLTGCWWVYTETMNYGVVAKFEMNFDNSMLTSIIYANSEKQAEIHMPYTIEGNNISISRNNTVVVYAKNGYSVKGNSLTCDYSITGNNLTLSNGKLDGVAAPIINSNYTPVLTRK